MNTTSKGRLQILMNLCFIVLLSTSFEAALPSPLGCLPSLLSTKVPVEPSMMRLSSSKTLR